MLVLDANILIRGVLGKRVAALLKIYSGSVSLLAPDSAFQEAVDNLPTIVRKRGEKPERALQVLQSLKEAVQPVTVQSYAAFEEMARRRIKGRDEDDWPVLALSLAYSFPIWTEDRDFFGTGVATWTSNLVEIFLLEVAASVDDAPPAEN